MPDTPVSEQLADQRQANLIRSAQEKIEAGKSPTLAEVQAIRKAEKRDARKKIEAVPPISKGLFVEAFGGDRKLYTYWKKHYKFPWPDGRKSMDLMAVMAWYLKHTKELHHAVKKLPSEVRTDKQDADTRRREALAKKAELDIERLQRNLIDKAEVEYMFGLIANKLREGLESVGRISMDAQDIMLEKIGEMIVIYDETNGSNVRKQFEGNGISGRLFPDSEKGTA